ncbi:fatty-acyl-CoA synthase [Actinoplanes lobatus]|uniref:Fatty-acyl-CoA synthase n=1 Tax=Actinoplanes lobatus TaxID=113568 RepID=A0A7W7HGJ4_9ACTN|nr:long-chain fatty acid--CoA ligase [Actinoplanes lobatus]MBB4750130.1 fatty-acyl-CoA synthase [Actinoplanes lobatus]GGN75319.1 fatty-acyl-CoA synthase [Actinoplanes lobatus]GIE38982.1 fatty-acyl-CoA synthase [Actinoplanes lobatus]
MRNAGLGSWPVRRAAMSPGSTALIFEERRTTYAQLHERTSRLAAALRAAGVRPGDRVAYLGPNHPSFVETMFATWALGAVFVPMNFRLTEPEIEYQLRHSGAVALIHALPVSAAASIKIDIAEYESWLAEPAEFDEPVTLDDVACILYTSGTTGHPKGAMLTHGNLVWNCYNLLVCADIAGDEVTLVSAPLFHVAALNQCLLPTFLKGGTSVIMPGWDVDGCFDAITRYGVTWMFGVSTMFAALSRSPRWPTADLSSVRCLMTGGAAVPEALIRTYQDRGLAFCQGYGMTETAPGATFLEARESRDHVGSAGLPVFFADVRCVRPDLTPAPPGEPGEVLVRGPNVTPGYWNDPAATAAAFTDGWFRSGDLAVVGTDGHFRIVDRTKDMYISGGENVYPAEVEAAIFEHPAVAEAAVVGVPDEKWGEVGRAFVVPVPGATLNPGDIPAYLAGRLARYKIPVYVDIVTDLPRTGSGKVRKDPLRDLPLPQPAR